MSETSSLIDEKKNQKTNEKKKNVNTEEKVRALTL